MKPGKGCIVALVLCIAVIVVLVISGPLLFRVLPANIQAGIARRAPIFSAWVATSTPGPTRAYTADSLPTTDPSRAAAAIALLDATEADTVTPAPTNTATLPATLPPTRAIPTAGDVPTLAPPTLVASLPPTNTSAPSPSPLPTVAPTMTFTLPPLPAAFRLDNYEWVPQTWNNCGPANLTQILNHFGVKTEQKDAAAWLKPSTDDGNVSPWQLVTYVQQFTPLHALQRYNGNIELLKRLVAARFGVMIETGLLLPGEAWMGHYLTLIAYDDLKGVFYGLDSYLGTGPDHQGMPENYRTLDSFWQHFNRVYMVLYPPERENELLALLGPDADVKANAERSLATARQEAHASPANPYAWFNLGTSYVLLGDYKNAASAYDQSRNAGEGLPYRMLWYQFGPFLAYYAVADYDTANKLINATLGTTIHIEELWYWRGLVRAAQGNAAQAVNDFNSVLRFNTNFKPAADALASVQAGKVPALPASW